jgi:hypothetical protein
VSKSEVLQERISRALAISHGYARFASRLNECSCVIMSLVLAVCLAAEKECHQIWRRVMLLLLRESAIVLTTLDAAPQPSLMPKKTVLLETHVNTGVTSKATLRQVLALQRSSTHLMLAEIIKTVQMSTTTLAHSISSVRSRNESVDTATGAITAISSETRAIMVRHAITGRKRFRVLVENLTSTHLKLRKMVPRHTASTPYVLTTSRCTMGSESLPTTAELRKECLLTCLLQPLLLEALLLFKACCSSRRCSSNCCWCCC